MAAPPDDALLVRLLDDGDFDAAPRGPDQNIHRRSSGPQHSDDDDDDPDDDATASTGSSVGGAVFNFTNAMIGAGCLGLGCAMARSGGLVSCLTIFGFAWLFKQSLDLLIELSLRHGGATAVPVTFAQLAHQAFGERGRLGLMASQFLYSFGCLVAYVVVCKDNLGSAVRSLLYGHTDGDDRSDSHPDASTLEAWLGNDILVTWCISGLVLLPLCLLRDMTPLSIFSVVSIASMVTVAGIVVYLYFAPALSPAIRKTDGTLYEHWFQVRPEYWACLGTFVFTFASQHVVHMAFYSLKPRLRTLKNWKRVSTCSMSISAAVSLCIGLFVYMTFWESTRSNIFELYPGIFIVNTAKLLLCINLLLTFPIPFFSCRQLLLQLALVELKCQYSGNNDGADDDNDDRDGLLIETTPSTHDNPDDPLLELEACSLDDHSGTHSQHRHPPRRQGLTRHVRMSSFHEAATAAMACRRLFASSGDSYGNDQSSDDDENDDQDNADNYYESVENAFDERGAGRRRRPVTFVRGWRSHVFRAPIGELQLRLLYHILLTILMWVIVIHLAIAAPNLTDVLDVVGCASGTLIAFFFPGAIAYRLDGYSWKAALIFGTGVLVAPVGTFYSVKKLMEDLRQ